MTEQDGIELRWILTVVRRWIWMIVGCALLAAVVALIVTAQMTPYYEATAILIIQPAQDTLSSEYSALIAGERLALTYSEMLKGHAVLDRVVSQNQLTETSDQLAKRVSAQPIRDTQLIRLKVKDASPKQAVTLANAIAQEFTGYIQTLQTERYAGSLNNLEDSMEALSFQMEAIQAEIQTWSAKKIETEAELARLESLLTEYSLKDQQLQEEYRSLLLTVSTLTDHLSIAETARASSTRTTNAAIVTLLLDQASLSGGSSYSGETYEKMLTGRPVLEAAITELELDTDPDLLTERLSVATVPGTQLIELSVVDPNISQATLLADTIAKIFIEQMKALQEKPYSDRVNSLQAQMDLLQIRIAGVQTEIAALTADKLELETEIAILQQQLTEFRSDYRALQQDYGQMQLTVANAGDAVVIAEPASGPERSTQPRVLYIGLAAVVSAVTALGAAFLMEYLDDVVRTPEDVYQVLSLSTLGSISMMKEHEIGLVAVTQPRSPVAEAFRVLATNLRISCMDPPRRTILVTSPHPQEGKSLVVANLAVVLAQRELRVVAVDADLRLPRLHQLFGLDQGKGVTGALLDGHAGEELQQVSITGLRVLTSGDLPPNPAEVLASERMRRLLAELARDTDLVLIDCPPVLQVADSTILASMVDGVVLVGQADRTRRQELHDAVENLRKVGANLLGVVLNGVSSRDNRYYKYSGGKNREEINGWHRWKKSAGKVKDWLRRDGSRAKESRHTELEVNQAKKALLKLAKFFKSF